jgi:cation transport ATPase
MVLRRTPGVFGAKAWHLRERADARFDPERTSRADLAAALARAGFDVAGVRQPAETAWPTDLGIGAAALLNLLVLHRLPDANTLGADVVRILLAALALAVVGVPLARRAAGLLREGILGREALAAEAIGACFSAGVLDVWSVHHGRPATAGGFEAAAAIAFAAVIGQAVEAALYRRAMHALAESGKTCGRPLAEGEAELDAAVRTALEEAFARRVEPAAGSWEDAAARGLVTAALACSSFVIVTQAWLGAGPFSPRALLAAAAVLAGVSLGEILAARPAARAFAVLRARAAGVLVRDPLLLEALTRVDTVCFEVAGGEGVRCSASALRALERRGIRALALRLSRPDRDSAAAVQGLQRAGARVLVVGEAGGAALRTGADVTIAVAAGGGGVSGGIVVAPAAVLQLDLLLDLGRALRRALLQNATLAALYNAVVIPAAALGFVTPLLACALVLAETLLVLANAARLMRH